MSFVTCPRCGAAAGRAGFPAWVVMVAICLFPVGLLALLAGRSPSMCAKCGTAWQA